MLADLCAKKETRYSMTNNRLYNDIINRPEQLRDHELFEQFAVDFLCHRGHDAALIPSGNDRGMDVEIADGEGEPYPGIVTTSDRVLQNMTRNLNRYVAEGGPRQKCIVVTSVALTPTKISKLRSRARALGFTLIEKYAQNEIASYLYDNARWRKDLLGLPGYPTALSKRPPTNREIPDRDLVGREEAMAWLWNTPGDRLLVGDSGSGKTSLLNQLTKDEERAAWFIVDKDREEIANAIREIDPKILMLDGAFKDREFIKQMMRLRNDPEINGDFSFIVTCWNGEREKIEPIVSEQVGKTYELRRLIQDDMVKVINGAGSKDNIWLLREIVPQAAGLPGMAVTIADLASRRGVEKIQTAEALSNAILQFYESVIERPVRAMLASFAFGGNAGMYTDTVSKILDISPGDLYESLRNLTSGGVIAEVPKETPDQPDHIKVRPDALRHALIRDVFLSGASSLSQPIPDGLIDQSPDPKATAAELIGAKARGGKFEVGFLESYIAQLEDNLWQDYQQALAAWSPEARESFGVTRSVWIAQQKIHHIWETFAWQGYDEASWVIEHFTVKASLVAPPRLHFIPQLAIPKLLTEAEDDNRALHSNAYHPLRLLQDWVKGAHPSAPEPFSRRKEVLRGTKKWLEAGNDSTTGHKAMLFAMILHYENMMPKPGSGNDSMWQEAFLTEPDLHSLQPFWKEIIECTRVIEMPNWQGLLDSIRDWAYPFRGHSPPEETRQSMTSFAIEMALDVKNAAANHIGVLYRLQRLMQRSYPDLEIFNDDVIDTLYPDRPMAIGWETQEENWTHAADELADRWIKLEPQEEIEQRDAIELDLSQERPRLTPDLCYLMADYARSTAIHAIS